MHGTALDTPQFVAEPMSHCRWSCCCGGTSVDDAESEDALCPSGEYERPPAVRRKKSIAQQLRQSAGGLWQRMRGKRGVVRLAKAASSELSRDSLPSCVLPYDMRLELLPSLPFALRHRHWQRLFSTAEDGCSLRTAYGHLQDQGPVLLLVQDRNKRVCGGLVSGASWEPSDHTYQGTGESLLFTWWPDGFRAHHWSRRDEHFLLASLDCLALGGGQHFGLWLGPSLSSGSTGSSTTFGNHPPLAEHDHRGGLAASEGGGAAGGGASAFEIVEVQAFGFEGLCSSTRDSVTA